MKKIFFRPTIIMILIAASTFAQPDSTSQDANNIKRFRFKYTLSDGVDLIADMYYPDPLKKHPAIFIRTPYNKKQHSSLGEFLAKHGYVVVIQDVRGTGQSKGSFIPFANEIRNGMEMLGWIEGQDWFNGQIGMWGGSYLSYCAAVLACQNPPSLKSVFSISGGYNLEKSILPGGAFHLMINAAWFHFSKSQQDTSLKKINVNDLMNTVPLENAFEKMNAELPSQWLIYFTVKNIEVSVKKCIELRGKILVPLKTISGYGGYCVIQDPAGPVSALFEPK
ncbi:MAG: CocE/NonD family hydrolase [Ignavibacteriales bacterium]|nr:CocE/NonD family hydrolase [Ignavibacteriales bacterium]